MQIFFALAINTAVVRRGSLSSVFKTKIRHHDPIHYSRVNISYKNPHKTSQTHPHNVAMEICKEYIIDLWSKGRQDKTATAQNGNNKSATNHDTSYTTFSRNNQNGDITAYITLVLCML